MAYYSNPKTMSLKLLIDAGNNKVLFAESGKDFVDFMFSLLLLPLGSIIKLVNPRKMLGSIGKLYQSVGNIDETYLVANVNKSTLLQPSVSALPSSSPLQTILNTPYNRYCKSIYSSGDPNRGVDVAGFVKTAVTYMITDDLEITPMSAISSISLINSFSMKKDYRLEEKAVVVGMEEGIALLAASLKSSTALTDVFLSSSAKKVALTV